MGARGDRGGRLGSPGGGRRTDPRLRSGLIDRIAEQLGPRGRDSQLAAVGLAPVASVEALRHNTNNAVTGAVEKLTLQDGSELVRKVLCRDRPTTVPHWPAGSDPLHWNHWRRELHAHSDGFAERFAGSGVRAPKLVGHVEAIDGVHALFLEFEHGATGAQLGVDDLCVFATALGRTQGADPVPAGKVQAGCRSWWSAEWMWQYALSRPPGPAGYIDVDAWDHPVVVAGFGDARERLRARFGELMADAERWRALYAALPTAASHLDCWANNMVLGADDDAVLLDWSFCGTGVLGEDVGNMVPDGLLDHYAEPEEYDRQDAAVWESYRRGLAEAGWSGDEDLPRLGMCLAVMKFVWLPASMVANAGWQGPTGYGGLDGPDLVEVFRRRAKVFDSMLDRMTEAARLARRCGLMPAWSASGGADR